MTVVTQSGRVYLALAVAVALVMAGTGVAARPGQGAARAALLNPAALKETAPPIYHAVFNTSVGVFVVRVHREWAPRGADRFYNLVKNGFYDDCRFFRVVKGFMAQFGIHGNPAVSAAWSRATLPIERSRQSNTRGRVTFAMGDGPATRSTQVFINFRDNSRLDIDGFAPIGEVVSSMIIVELLFDSYGELPDQGLLQRDGNAFLAKDFPRLDYIRKATIEP
jgi:peptidyl-prolyl cis-trans isomerase A (cyclophilin A)